MARPDRYRVGRSFGSGRKPHAFTLSWENGRPVIGEEDEDFGPDSQERDAVIAHFARSHRVRTGGAQQGRQVEALKNTDPRTREGFDAVVYLLPPPWVLI